MNLQDNIDQLNKFIKSPQFVVWYQGTPVEQPLRPNPHSKSKSPQWLIWGKEYNEAQLELALLKIKVQPLGEPLEDWLNYLWEEA